MMSGVARLSRRAPLRCVLFSLLALSAAGATLPARAGSLSPACAVPDQLVRLDGDLDRVIARIHAARGPVRILAIGSSSTSGVGASSPAATYPAQLEEELAERIPEAKFDVENAGIAGEVIVRTAERLEQEVAADPPDLVIWQVGTNDALAGVGQDSFARVVESGLAFLEARKIDVILMDQQMFPKIEGNAAYAGFVDRVHRLASGAGVPVVQRFAAMAKWATRPKGEQVDMLWKDRFHMNDQGYACVAELVAEGLARRADPAGAPASGTTPAVSPLPAGKATPADGPATGAPVSAAPAVVRAAGL
ncbi:SGNH/GDSL hydrolase family protein [Segnochrobactraceae bacterium EtOH-i3]